MRISSIVINVSLITKNNFSQSNSGQNRVNKETHTSLVLNRCIVGRYTNTHTHTHITTKRDKYIQKKK